LLIVPSFPSSLYLPKRVITLIYRTSPTHEHVSAW
jgi:hypothetical protein